MIPVKMTKEELKEKIITVLDYSDIVWTKYGNDTKDKLADKIINLMNN